MKMEMDTNIEMKTYGITEISGNIFEACTKTAQNLKKQVKETKATSGQSYPALKLRQIFKHPKNLIRLKSR